MTGIGAGLAGGEVLRMSVWYWLSRVGVKALAALLLRLHFEGSSRVPRRGGLLVVSNHMNIADPPLLAGALTRPLAFMAKTELFRGRWWSAILRTWGVFPVRRGEIDVAAVRAALALLRAGGAVVIFPEGTRHPDGLGEALPGIAYLAARSGCAILPIGITGTEQLRGLRSLLHRPEVWVRVGEPFNIGRGDALEGAEHIMHSIAALIPPAKRGRYGALPGLDGRLEEPKEA
ncbi:MAG: 1-acyl-sn-glycerol-3-phosphate acyltransferase [Chloroflexi bacterium]|nr:1-acyl-sn-glycerol-3-phosphate acyltransferase [Chloroflexota bacterium]